MEFGGKGKYGESRGNFTVRSIGGFLVRFDGFNKGNAVGGVRPGCSDRVVLPYGKTFNHVEFCDLGMLTVPFNVVELIPFHVMFCPLCKLMTGLPAFKG